MFSNKVRIKDASVYINIDSYKLIFDNASLG